MTTRKSVTSPALQMEGTEAAFHTSVGHALVALPLSTVPAACLHIIIYHVCARCIRTPLTLWDNYTTSTAQTLGQMFLYQYCIERVVCRDLVTHTK